MACTAYAPLVRTSVPPASPHQPTDAHLRCAARRKQTQTRSGGFFEPAASRVASDRRCVYDYVSLCKRTRASFEQRRRQRPPHVCYWELFTVPHALASKGALPWCARRLLATMGCSSKWRSRRASDRTSFCSKRMEYSHTPRLRTRSNQTLPALRCSAPPAECDVSAKAQSCADQSVGRCCFSRQHHPL